MATDIVRSSVPKWAQEGYCTRAGKPPRTERLPSVSDAASIHSAREEVDPAKGYADKCKSTWQSFVENKTFPSLPIYQEDNAVPTDWKMELSGKGRKTASFEVWKDHVTAEGSFFKKLWKIFRYYVLGNLPGQAVARRSDQIALKEIKAFNAAMKDFVKWDSQYPLATCHHTCFKDAEKDEKIVGCYFKAVFQLSLASYRIAAHLKCQDFAACIEAMCALYEKASKSETTLKSESGYSLKDRTQLFLGLGFKSMLESSFAQIPVGELKQDSLELYKSAITQVFFDEENKERAALALKWTVAHPLPERQAYLEGISAETKKPFEEKLQIDLTTLTSFAVPAEMKAGERKRLIEGTIAPAEKKMAELLPKLQALGSQYQQEGHLLEEQETPDAILAQIAQIAQIQTLAPVDVALFEETKRTLEEAKAKLALLDEEIDQAQKTMQQLQTRRAQIEKQRDASCQKAIDAPSQLFHSLQEIVQSAAGYTRSEATES